MNEHILVNGASPTTADEQKALGELIGLFDKRENKQKQISEKKVAISSLELTVKQTQESIPTEESVKESAEKAGRSSVNVKISDRQLWAKIIFWTVFFGIYIAGIILFFTQYHPIMAASKYGVGPGSGYGVIVAILCAAFLGAGFLVFAIVERILGDIIFDFPAPFWIGLAVWALLMYLHFGSGYKLSAVPLTVFPYAVLLAEWIVLPLFRRIALRTINKRCQKLYPAEYRKAYALLYKTHTEVVTNITNEINRKNEALAANRQQLKVLEKESADIQQKIDEAWVVPDYYKNPATLAMISAPLRLGSAPNVAAVLQHTEMMNISRLNHEISNLKEELIRLKGSSYVSDMFSMMEHQSAMDDIAHQQAMADLQGKTQKAHEHAEALEEQARIARQEHADWVRHNM